MSSIPAYTTSTLGWEPSPRNDLKEGCLFLIENMKNHSVEWNVRNETQMIRTASRFNIQAYDLMLKNRELVINKMFDFINLKDNIDYFPNYQENGSYGTEMVYHNAVPAYCHQY